MSNRKLERLKREKKRKKMIHTFIAVLIIFCACYIKINPMDKGRATESEAVSQIEEIQQTEEVEEVLEEIEDPTVEEKEIDENNNKDIVTENDVSEEVKKIVEKYINNQDLSEENFAFFYYNPMTAKSYFYNEDTFFTAASTIKVPLAMIYYDKINNGDLTLDSKLQYKSWQYEAGTGNTASTYNPGDNIPLSFLLEEMIINSDNTATNILKEDLGGEKAYRILIKQYTTRDLPEEFNDENITSAGYSYDVLKRLYENQDKYKDLIEHMKKSSGGGYLKKEVENYEIAHKYGSFEGNVHDYGICYTENEYLIGIFTRDRHDAEDLISNINKEIIQLK